MQCATSTPAVDVTLINAIALDSHQPRHRITQYEADREREKRTRTNTAMYIVVVVIIIIIIISAHYTIHDSLV